jgi:hypothetical protein
VRFPARIPASLFFLPPYFLLAVCCTAAELRQETIGAFDHYVRVSEAPMDTELRPGGPFLWVDALPEARRQQIYARLRSGRIEIRREQTEEDGKSIEIPGGLIHHWSGIVFVPGESNQHAVSFLQDYDTHWRTYGPDIRRSKLLEHTDNTFKIYLQFYKDSPVRVSFNAEFEVHYRWIDARHVESRAVSTRIAELEHPEQPESAEIPVGRGHGYLWRLNNYWRLEEKDGGVYIQVESIALSRDVPAIFAWFVNPLIRRVSRKTLASLLDSSRKGLLHPPLPQASMHREGKQSSRTHADGSSLPGRHERLRIPSYFFAENDGLRHFFHRPSPLSALAPQGEISFLLRDSQVALQNPFRALHELPGLQLF